MISASTSRRVLETLLLAYPGEGVILGLRLQAGWGDIVQVEVSTGREPGTGLIVSPQARGEIRSAIMSAIPDQRLSVRVLPVESSPLRTFGDGG